MPRGRPPDLKRWQQIFELRADGLPMKEIGARLGVTRQRVEAVLRLNGKTRLVPVRCRECHSEITKWRIAWNLKQPVWCLRCLAKHRQATFGQRLRAHRLSAGLTLKALEQRSGVPQNLINGYECDRAEPKWRTLAKLIRALGVQLVDVK